MKKKIILCALLASVSFLTLAEEHKTTSTDTPKKESSYRKATKFLDGLVQKVKPAAEKAAQAVVDDSVQSLKDFEEDINAPKEKQSGFAKFFNFISDVDVNENLKKSGACYDGPVEEVPEGIF